MIGETLAELAVKITTDTSGLVKGLGDAEGKLSNFGSIAKKVGIGIAAIGVAAVGAGIASVKAFADAGSEIYDMSKRTGFGAQALSELKYMAEQSGASLGSVETAAKRMAVAITEANAGSKAQVEAFKNLGVSLEQLKGMKPEEQFMKVASAIANIPDPIARSAAAVDIFGRSGTELLSMLSEGEAGMEAMKKRAAELGVVFTDKTAADADKLGDALNDVQKVMQGVMNEVGMALMPTIKLLADQFVLLVKTLPLDELGRLLNAILPPLVSILIRLMNAIPIDTVIRFVTAALTPLLKILEAILPVLEPILYLVGMLLNILTPVLDILGRILSFIARIIGSGITSIISGIGSLFGGQMTNFEMPSFASGGIVPGGIGQPQLAMVHGGETIIPVGGSGESSINLYIDGERVTSVIEKRMNNKVRLQEVTGY